MLYLSVWEISHKVSKDSAILRENRIGYTPPQQYTISLININMRVKNRTHRQSHALSIWQFPIAYSVIWLAPFGCLKNFTARSWHSFCESKQKPEVTSRLIWKERLKDIHLWRLAFAQKSSVLIYLKNDKLNCIRIWKTSKKVPFSADLKWLSTFQTQICLDSFQQMHSWGTILEWTHDVNEKMHDLSCGLCLSEEPSNWVSYLCCFLSRCWLSALN